MTLSTVTPSASDGYAADMQRVELRLADLRRQVANGVGGTHLIRQEAYGTYERAQLVGSASALESAVATINSAIERTDRWPDLVLAKAKVELALHHPSAARSLLAYQETAGAGDENISTQSDWIEDGNIKSSREGKALLADIDMQEGRYEQALRMYLLLVEEAPTWANLARLASFRAAEGKFAEADSLYTRALCDLTAKEMRPFAWLLLQRGKLDHDRGALESSLRWYRLADSSYPGYWRTKYALAKNFRDQGIWEQALDLGEELVAIDPRPEFQDLLAEVYHQVGRTEEARVLQSHARAVYLETSARGNNMYVHHLAQMCLDEIDEPCEGLRWAAMDYKERPNSECHLLLAWAHYRAGHTERSRIIAVRALASGMLRPEALKRAAEIMESAGDGVEAVHVRQRLEDLSQSAKEACHAYM